LVRPRRSRIYFLRSFFDYPIALNGQTVKNLGPWRMLKIGAGYLNAKLFPRKNEKTLEDFLINRFGTELYLTFFKSYTEKVWGVPCDKISAAWGAQRIKGLSLWKAAYHFVQRALLGSGNNDISQKGTETSLIEQFLYPKLGPGQLWEYVAGEVTSNGGEVLLEMSVDKFFVEGNKITGIETKNERTGEKRIIKGDYFFSTMPVQELVRALDVEVPAAIKEISDGLVYRDFITVGVLVKQMLLNDENVAGGKGHISDTWIYIQEPDVKLGRLQIFNNWSPYMVADPSKTWLGLEYFCNETDEMWQWDDATMVKFAAEELAKIGMIKTSDVEDATVIRVPKTYPGYFGTYDRFDELRSWIDGFENLFLVGRNGMHKYNNQDHSMLTAIAAVENIVNGVKTKDNLWAINTEEDYHEERKE
ncbi:MAG TPA: NAD(P)/FAD-dependent oxidoreductase, partial [Trichormus sp.]